MDWDLLLPGSLFIATGLAGVWLSFAGIADTFLQGLQMISAYIFVLGLILFPGGLLKDGLPSPRGIAAAVAGLIITVAFTLFLMYVIITF